MPPERKASKAAAEPDKRSRRRGAELENAILQAAFDEVAEGGYARLTMDGVAQRAGTNKTAIYRRWPNRAALALAAHRQFVAQAATPPDTGELRSDVLALLRGVVARMASSVGGEILRGAMSELHQQPELIRELREILADEPGTMMTILTRAVARGEARPAALTPRVAAVPVVLLRHEYQISGPVLEIPDETVVEIVDQVFLPMVRT
ncbi:TetR/AcrR family transcriptional regulator [Saccharopolyspora sp. K220]|uniref:TetR/AcrR family transcriptional regulator n=1 Tax=Saccharopolyspora soli TaxID=2926618 RepID=UPI001F5A71D0|nr:TetR/AcrR family transcriptional regulator [Saccharopolyspora soli]MCI2418803.1 TetR/AcrR family transcriptional regulator [Saccharopolyspora soli]